VSAILFDEPLTVIDPEDEMDAAHAAARTAAALGMTMIYVTHDQTEALTFASVVVVMHEGQVVQIGSPEELFEKPAHTFVGYFIGSPGMNVHADESGWGGIAYWRVFRASDVGTAAARQAEARDWHTA
jgi:glycerol transport system ATP-binding protein